MDENRGVKNNVSRRRFLKGAAVAAAAAGGIVAETGSAKTANAAQAKETPYSVDICIIGGAGAGLIAAVSTAEAGAKKILVLEKMKAVGGTTIGIGGLFGIESPVQKRLGIHDTADFCFKHHMDMTNVHIMAAAMSHPTGDGLVMAEEIGAASTHISTLFIGPHGHGWTQ